LFHYLEDLNFAGLPARHSPDGRLSEFSLWQCWQRVMEYLSRWAAPRELPAMPEYEVPTFPEPPRRRGPLPPRSAEPLVIIDDPIQARTPSLAELYKSMGFAPLMLALKRLDTIYREIEASGGYYVSGDASEARHAVLTAYRALVATTSPAEPKPEPTRKAPRWKCPECGAESTEINSLSVEHRADCTTTRTNMCVWRLCPVCKSHQWGIMGEKCNQCEHGHIGAHCSNFPPPDLP
jgi:hypothetical protein